MFACRLGLCVAGLLVPLASTEPAADLAPATRGHTHPCGRCPPEPPWEADSSVASGGEGNETPPLRAAIRLDVPLQTFEAWGTSLCWWANGVGSWTNTSAFNEMLDLIFSDFPFNPATSPPKSLGLTFARYNIGGGENPKHAHFMRPGALMDGFQRPDRSWDWEADKTQRRVLAGALARGVQLVQAFSNSPPYWMTRSGSATGEMAGLCNLRDGMWETFAEYLSTIVGRFASDRSMLFGRRLVFDALTPLNEPNAKWWIFGNNQEGCHFDPSDQSRILKPLREALNAKGLQGVALAAAEENQVEETASSVAAYWPAAAGNMSVVTTHTYGAVKGSRERLAEWALSRGKRMWASEYGTGSGPLQGGVRLAQQITDDLNRMHVSVWTLWQVADLRDDLSRNGWGLMAATYGPSAGPGSFVVRKQYAAFKQFTAFIRPGAIILLIDGVDRTEGVRLLAARQGSALVLVATAAGGAWRHLSLQVLGAGGASHRISSVAGYRTDESLDCAPVAAPPITAGGSVEVDLPPASITTFVLRTQMDGESELPTIVV